MSATANFSCRCAAAVLAAFAAAAPLHAQEPIGEVKISAISELHPDWLNEGVESPNGRYFVFRSYADDAFVRYDRVARRWTSEPGVAIGPQARWSPNGRFLAFVRAPENTRDRFVWVLPMDSSTGVPRGTARRISTRPGSWPAWSPDSRRIAFSVQDSGRFRLMTVPFNGGDEEVLYDSRGRGGDIAWSPDGKHLFAGHGHGTTQIPRYWLRVNALSKQVDSFPLIVHRILGYSPDGRLVAHHDGEVMIISSATDGRTVQRLRIPRRVTPTGWSRSVSNAITGIQRVVPSHVQRVSLSDGRIQSLTPVDSAGPGDGDVRYSPDGRQIAFVRQASGFFRLHVANSDGSGIRAVGVPGLIGQFKWSPSGRQIAYPVEISDPTAGFIGGIHVVDAVSGVDRELVRSNGDAGASNNLAWRSDGQAVRYIWYPRGPAFPKREAREMSLDRKERVLATLATAALDGEPHFVSDSLLLLRKATGIDAVSLRTGALRSLYNGPMRAWNEFGVSADGNWVAFSADGPGHDIPTLVSVNTGEVRRIPYSLKGELATLFFHPDGRNLVASVCLTCGPGVEKWDVALVPMNGDPPRVLTASQPSYKDFGFPRSSPDGRYVIFGAEQSYNTRVVTLTLPKP